jgi:hypothetical protein
MSFSKIAGLGCLGLIGLSILLSIIGIIGRALMTPEQRAAEVTTQQAAAAKEKADEQAATEKKQAAKAQAANELIRKFTLMRRQLPRPEQVNEIPLPDSIAPENILYEPVDYTFLMQFAETGFSPPEVAQAVPFYRGRILGDVQKALTTDQTREKRDAALAQAAAGLEDKLYFIVFLPLEEEWPKVNADNKTYESGYFAGWEIVIDAKKLQRICAMKFEASNSAKVS